MTDNAVSVDVRLRRGQFDLDVRFDSNADAVALFGPSGAGKSTVLSLVAGLIKPHNGRIVIAGKTVVDTRARVWVPPRKRRVGMVFQDALLFPHLSVRDNLQYGRPADPKLNQSDLIELLGISHLLTRRPETLSGGERQRVAIGRALLAEPDVLLLDEPLASLDHARRQEIVFYLNRLHDSLSIPMLHVSHAPDDVIRLSDDVVLIENGRVVGHGAPQDLLLPVSGMSEGFGAVSVLEAVVDHYDEADGITELVHPAGRISLPGRVGEPGKPYRVLVRTTDVAIAVARPREISHRTLLRGRITKCERSDSPLVAIDLDLSGSGRLGALVTRRAVNELGIDVGDDVYALAKASAMDDRAFRQNR